MTKTHKRKKEATVALSKKEKERLLKKSNKDLDRELLDTFPASDPVNKY